MGFVWIDSAAGRVCSQFGQGAEPIVGDLLFKLALGEVHFTVKHLSRIPASFTLICCVLLIVVSLRFLHSLLCQFILEAWVSFVPEVFCVTLPKSKHLPVPNMRTHCCDTWEVSRWSCCNSTPMWSTAGLGLLPPARCCITVLLRVFSLLFWCSRIPKTCAKNVGNCKYSLSMAHFGSTAGNHSHPNVFVLQ